MSGDPYDRRYAPASRRGIEVMTAWLEAAPGVPADEVMWQVIGANVAEGREAEVQMILGLQGLASILLVLLSDATGRSAAEILQEIGQKYAT